MTGETQNLEEILSTILRGAAKILGCNSTNLIMVNEAKQEMTVCVGTMADSYPVLAEIDTALTVRGDYDALKPFVLAGGADVPRSQRALVPQYPLRKRIRT